MIVTVCCLIVTCLQRGRHPDSGRSPRTLCNSTDRQGRPSASATNQFSGLRRKSVVRRLPPGIMHVT